MSLELSHALGRRQTGTCAGDWEHHCYKAFVIISRFSRGRKLTRCRPFSPYTMLKLVELMNQVYPPGVVSVLSGDDKYVCSRSSKHELTPTQSWASHDNASRHCKNHFHWIDWCWEEDHVCLCRNTQKSDFGAVSSRADWRASRWPFSGIVQ